MIVFSFPSSQFFPSTQYFSTLNQPALVAQYIITSTVAMILPIWLFLVVALFSLFSSSCHGFQAVQGWHPSRTTAVQRRRQQGRRIESDAYLTSAAAAAAITNTCNAARRPGSAITEEESSRSSTSTSHVRVQQSSEQQQSSQSPSLAFSLQNVQLQLRYCKRWVVICHLRQWKN